MENVGQTDTSSNNQNSDNNKNSKSSRKSRGGTLSSQTTSAVVKACVQFGAHQFVVKQGDTIRVPKTGELEGASGEDESSKKSSKNSGLSQTDNVLAIITAEGIRVGAPYVENASVQYKVVGHVKGKKVIAFKFKKRKGYHKKQGYRQSYMILNVVGVTY